jgi:hypothetical protein
MPVFSAIISPYLESCVPEKTIANVQIINPMYRSINTSELYLFPHEVYKIITNSAFNDYRK